MVTPASFVTPDIQENADLQRWVRAKAPLGYLINRRPFRLLQFVMQMLYSPMHANPLEDQYYSNVPFLLGEGQAVQYSLKPTQRGPQPHPDAAVGELPARRDGEDPHRGRVGDGLHGAGADRSAPHADRERVRPLAGSACRPTSLSRGCGCPPSGSISDGQLAFADVLRYNPWHSLAEHRPLGNSNRARRTMYWELAKLRQAMNHVEHVEPTGQETFG